MTKQIVHTPGPWSADRIWDIPETKVHAYCCGKPYALAEVYPMPSADEREANARLIAAAPELLQALRELLHECEEAGFGTAKDYGWPRVFRQSRDAINKATGHE
jgi:hypothetical protein